MKDLAWNRTDQIAEVRERIWSYLSPASRFEEEGLLVAAALLKWPTEDAVKLGELQFLLSDQVGRVLEVVPSLLRKLTTASSREEEWDSERLRGPVLWSRTLALRAAGGSPRLWVTSPARRDYQTVENRMLVHVLDAIIGLGRKLGWSDQSSAEPSVLVRQRITEAEFWLQSRLLTQIVRVPLSPREVGRVRGGRANQRYAQVIEAYDWHESLVRALDREAVRAAVEHAGLVTANEGTLFELLCLFKTVDALKAAGWLMSPIRLFHGRIQLTGRRPDGRRLNLNYQSNPGHLRASRYKTIQSLHSFTRPHELRPDMILRWDAINEKRSRWLLVECKLSGHGVADAATKALNDLLAYRSAFSAELDDQPGPYGLGLAWGQELLPNSSAEIMLATPDTLASALAESVR